MGETTWNLLLAHSLEAELRASHPDLGVSLYEPTPEELRVEVVGILGGSEVGWSSIQASLPQRVGTVAITDGYDLWEYGRAHACRASIVDLDSTPSLIVATVVAAPGARSSSLAVVLVELMAPDRSDPGSGPPSAICS